MEAPKQQFVKHIENRRLWGLAGGRIRVERWEQDHLHECRVCQGILVYLNQTTQPSESEDDERSVRDGMVTPRFAAGAKAPACSLIAPRQLPAASSLGEQRWF